MSGAIEQLDVLCHLAAVQVNAQAERLRADIALWWPAPCPPAAPVAAPHVAPDGPLRTPYLDEVGLRRGWFR